MATPRTILQRLRAIWPHALTVLADGGANDGVGVEVTGTSDGKVNVSATGASGAALALDESVLEQRPAQSGAAVTKSDTTVLAGVRALWIGGAGDVVITGQDDVDFTLVGVPAGTLLPIAAKKIKAATTATNIVALG